MIENIRLSFRGIFAHKMRSFLTMLGIIIGIASIIAIVSTIKGTNDQIEKNLIGSGNNTVKVALYQEDLEYSFDAGIPNGVPTVSKDTLESLKNIEHVQGVTLYRSRQSYQAIFRNNTSLDGGYIMGVNQDYFSIAGLTIKQGRGIAEDDNKKFRQVAVLDETSAKLLFGEENPIGKTIEISSTPFTIVVFVQIKKLLSLQWKALMIIIHIISLQVLKSMFQVNLGQSFISLMNRKMHY